MAIGDDEAFAARPESESIHSAPENEGTNASRFAIAGALTAQAAGQRIRDVPAVAVDAGTLETFGFSPLLLDAIQATGGRGPGLGQELSYFIENVDPYEVGGEWRAFAWTAFGVEGDPQARLGLLAAGLVSTLERESVAAAVALLGVLRSRGVRDDLDARAGLELAPRVWRLVMFELAPFAEIDDDGPRQRLEWDGERWSAAASATIRAALAQGWSDTLVAVLGSIARARVARAERSPDPVVRELAFAARLRRSDDLPLLADARRMDASGSDRRLVSTMVHGTWGWKGSWWYPGGDFHGWIKQHHRPRLYGDGMEFSWSGAYRRAQRKIAGDRFGRWARSVSAPRGLGTVFAHSYGGEVVARAINAGARVDELVLLSVPVNDHIRAALDRVPRVVDVRLKFDLVLALAGEWQKLPNHPNAVPHELGKLFWHHGASHAPEVWDAEDIAAEVGL